MKTKTLRKFIGSIIVLLLSCITVVGQPLANFTFSTGDCSTAGWAVTNPVSVVPSMNNSNSSPGCIIANVGTATGPGAFTANAADGYSYQSPSNLLSNDWMEFVLTGVGFPASTNYSIYFQTIASAGLFGYYPSQLSIQYNVDGAGWSASNTVSGVNTSSWSAFILNYSFTAAPTTSLAFRITGYNGVGSFFDVDNFQVQSGLSSCTITTGTISPLTYCSGGGVNVPFTITGTFVNPNVFIAELSDAAGSFASPTAIGALSGTSAGTVLATIPIATPSGTGYRIRVTGTNPVTVGTDNGSNITINTATVPTITGPASVCSGVSNTYYTEAGMSNYAWLVSPNGTITAGGGNTATITITYSTAGPETMQVSYTDASGCPSPVTTKNITVNALPTPTISGLQSVCVGATGVTYTTQTGMPTYTWNVTGGTITNDDNNGTITVTWNTVGAQNVSVNYIDGNGCTATQVTNWPVTVNPLPVPTLSGDVTVCLGIPTEYTTDAGMSGYLWNALPDGSVAASGNIATVTWTTTGAKTVDVNYTDLNGCTATQVTVLNVTVNPLPVPTISGPTPVCIYSTGNLYSTEAGMTGYNWSVVGGTITAGSGTQTITVTWNTAGAQSVSVNYTDGNGCTATAATVYPVTVNPLPVPTLTGNTLICGIPSPGNIYTTDPGMSNYYWTIVYNDGPVQFYSGSNTVSVTWGLVGLQSVSVLYTDLNGCTASPATVLPVDVHTAVTPTITGPTPVCQNSTGNVYSTQTGKLNYIWTVSAGGTITAGGGTDSPTVTVTWNTPGPQTVQVNYSEVGGCNATATYNVTVNPLPTPTVTSGQQIICGTGSPYQYTTQNGMFDYKWSVTPNGTITNGGTATATITWATTGTKNVYVYYRDANGCVATSVAYIVNVYPIPNPTITGPATPCVLSSGNAYGTQVFGTYLWTVSAGGTIVGANNTQTVTVTWNTSGAKTVTVYVTDAGGCGATKTYTVNVQPLPIPTITGPAAVCYGIGNQFQTETGKTGYTWTATNGGIITGGTTATPTITWNVGGTQTVTVNYTDSYGCTATQVGVKTVFVNTLPVPNITGPNSVCLGITNDYASQYTTGTFVWTADGGATVTNGSTRTATISWNSIGSKTVYLTYTDGNGCTNTPAATYGVTVNPLPVPTITGPAIPLCYGVGYPFSTQLGMTGYAWTATNGGIITGQGTATPTILWNASGTQTVTVTYYDGNGCIATSPTKYTVFVNPLPVPTINGPTPICGIPSPNNVYYTETGMTGYTWAVYSGDGIINYGLGTYSITVTWISAGSKTLTLYYTDANGCTSTPVTSKTVIVYALPTPTITGPAAPCLVSTNNTYTTQAGMTNYQWSVSAGGVISGATNTNTISVTWNTVGPQTVSVNYVDGNGCTATSPYVYNVDVKPLPSPTISGPNVVCQKSIGNLYTTEAGMTNYVWTVTGGTITSGTNTSTISVTWNTPGTQSVTVTYNDANGCAATSPTKYAVTVKAVPVPTITGPAAVCKGIGNQYYTELAGASNWFWTATDGSTILGQGTATATISWTATGTQVVTVVYDVNGCTATPAATKNVTVNPLPTPTISGPNDVCNASTGNVYTTQAGKTNYTWSVTGGIITTATNTNTITVTWNTVGTGTVSVNYNDINGCTAVAPTVYNVNVKALPVPTISGATLICGVPSPNTPYWTESGKTNYIWTVDDGFGPTLILNGGYLIYANWTSAGTKQVTVNYTDVNGCAATSPAVLSITVWPRPVPTITGPNEICGIGTSGIYSTETGMTGYTWSAIGGTVTSGGTTATATVSWTSTGTQSISVTYTDTHTCTPVTPTVLNVEVFDLPVPTITGPNNVCEITTGHVYFTETGMTNYRWTVSAGGVITTASNTFTITVNWNTPGLKTVSVYYEDANGCGATSTYSVNVNARPIVTIYGDISACVGDTKVYTTDPGFDYVWTVSAGGTVTGGTTSPTLTVTWNTAGPQFVTLNYADETGCTATQATIMNVTVHALPSPTITGPTVLCGTPSANNIYSTQTGQFNYIWYITSTEGTVTISGTSSVVLTWNATGQKVINVAYTDIYGCAAVSAPYTVNVYPLPVPTITGPTPVCALSTGNVYTTEAGMTNYAWTVAAGGTITAGAGTNAITVTWNTPGAKTVSVTYTDTHGCNPAAPTVKNVTVNPIPVPAISGPTPVCAGTTGNVYTTASGMTNYIWTVSAGGTKTANGGTNSPTITVTWNTAGTQSVSVIYTDGNGCTATQATIFNVTVNPLPTPVITGPAVICGTGSTTYTYATAAGKSNYKWTVSAGGTIVGSTTTSTATISWATTGVKTVSVYYTEATGCGATGTYTVNVYALPTPTIAGPATICGTPSAGNLYGTQAGKASYLWTVSAGGTITAGGTSQTATITWNTIGVKTVSVYVTESTGCGATATYTVNVYTPPTPVITGDNFICGIPAIGKVYSTAAGMTNYVWTVTGGVITAGGGSTSSTVTVNWNTAGAKTVSVLYTDVTGCTATKATVYNVNVYASPVPTITGPSLICGVPSTGNVYSTQTGMTNYAWTVVGGTITAGGGTNSPTVTVTWGTTGAKSVSVSYTDANGCPATQATVYNVNAYDRPVPTINGPTSICGVPSANNRYYTEAGMSNYTWVIVSGDGTIDVGSGTNEVFVTWTSAGPKTISVNYTAPSGCSALTSTLLNINVYALPVPTITGPASICNASTTQYGTEAGKSEYLWTVCEGGVIVGANNTQTVTVTWNQPGNHTVSVTYKDANGCTATPATVKNVTVNPLPAPTISGPASIGGIPSAGNVYTTEPGMTGYTWAVSAGGVITSATNTFSITVTWSSAGSQTVSVNYADGNGCTATSPTVYNVTVSALPIPVITGPASVCVGSTVTYSTAEGMTNYVWTVSPGGTVIGGTTSPTITVTWNATGAQFVTVNYTDGFGYTASVATVYNVVVHALPVPVITGPTSICGIPSVGNTYSTQSGMTNYNWTIVYGDGPVQFISGSNSVLITWATAGAKTVSVNYTDAYGCSASPATTLNVNVYALPVPTISGPASVCAGSTGNVYTTETGKTGYNWAVSTGGVITAGQGTANLTVTWNAAGARTVSVIYTDANGCTASPATVKNVTVNALPTPTITGPNSVCVGSTGNVYTTQAGKSNYLWTVSAGGTITAGGGANSSTVTVTWNTAGPQTVTVNYSDGNGCTATQAYVFNVTVNALPTPTIAGPNVICGTGTTPTYQYTTQVGKPYYKWTVSAGGTISGGGATATATIYWTTTGVKTVSVYYTEASGCGATGTYTVNVYALPAPTITGPASICGTPSAGNLYGTQAGKSNYKWTVSAGGTITAGGTSQTATITWNTPGAKTVYVYYTEASGCGATGTYTVNVYTPPVPVITGNNSVCGIPSVEVYSTAPSMNNYLWSVVGGTITAGATTNSITVNWNTIGANTVSVIYTDGNGCTATQATVYTVNVRALPTVTISGPTSICGAPSAGNVYTTQAGMTNYIWSVCADGTITSGTSSPTVTVTWNVAGVHTVHVIYTDLNGCTSSATLSVTVSTSTSLTGNIKYYTPGNPSATPPAPAYPNLNGVVVNLQQGGITIVSGTSDASGNYTIPNVCPGNYEIVLTSNAPTGGVNATDAGQVNYWGVYPNWSSAPLGPIEKVRLYAGDVVTNQMLNSGDAGRILQYYVTNGTPTWSPRALWTFWPRLDLVSANPPFGSTSVVYSTLTVPDGSGPIVKDFWGLATGDFNRDFDPTNAKSASDNLRLNYEQTRKVNIGADVEVPVYAKTAMEVGAMSVSLNIPSDKISVKDVVMNSKSDSPAMFNIVGDELRIGWYSLNPMAVKVGDVLFTLKVRTSGHLTENDIIRIDLVGDPLNEIADQDYRLVPNANLSVDLLKVTNAPVNTGTTLELSSVPNPFRDNVSLNYTLPEDGKVTLDVYNMLGERVKCLVNESQTAGNQTVKIDSRILPPGVYTLNLQLKTDSQVLIRTIKIVCN